MIVGYLKRDGLDFYRIKINKKTKEVTVSNLKGLSAFSFKRKVLVLSRDLYLHTTKNYPPASYKDLKRIIENEIKEIFPLKEPSFIFKIFQKTEITYTVHIWAWESSEIASVREKFNYSYVIPEDALFIAEKPEISIFISEKTNIIAYSKDGFIGSAVLKEFSIKDFELFTKSIARYINKPNELKIYSAVAEDIYEDLKKYAQELVLYSETSYPPCLQYLGITSIKEFKLPFRYDVVLKTFYPSLRFAVYFLIAICVYLFISVKNYESAIAKLKKNIEKLGVPVYVSTDETEQIYEEIQKKTDEFMNPLDLLNSLAEKLPDGAYVIRLSSNEKNLELTLTAKEPLEVIMSISKWEAVKSVKLLGAPTKSTPNEYNFRLGIELK